mmetsp:Transcript_51309/g.109063  ORF Transcript_51309/g.109063 Transcript_51309/m.109063 type:complete len:472 (-) Transcript_51309:221-1636(-)|eukprot:CAMPEP_0206458474 /NCGR_PEP_ID=MMETSP0324_2-20121206/23594_1 /ASSEMBLY_ACC=CAM_ASM_000836 /TAXON_ID=2866 /ORGANISM="Crypthecodinium cohnii, Strain Seligo" /LENGTH=471 /DNA_ID=CAMNT_0053929825 /DNA_START=99 /DNA_END=1514 /DNA_ORIENTATION=+
MTTAVAEAKRLLANIFPRHKWSDVPVVACELRVHPDRGAGLQLEATDFGYLVEGLDGDAHQDPSVCPGWTIVAIAGVMLLGYTEDDLEEVCLSHFSDGAPLLLCPIESLREALMDHKLVRVSLDGGSEFSAQLRQDLEADLKTFAARCHVDAALVPSTVMKDRAGAGAGAGEGLEGGDAVAAGERGAIFLLGIGPKIAASQPELRRLVAHYRGLSDSSERTSIQVGGMVMRSLPARNRRKRTVAEAEEEDREQIPHQDNDNRNHNGGGTTANEGIDTKAAAADVDILAAADAAAVSAAKRLKVEDAEMNQYEYMDHTADVILHSWGTSLRQAIGQVCVCFFSYMTDLAKIDATTSFEVEAKGHDILDMLYHLLDEFLFHFGTQFIMCRHVEVLDFDEATFTIKARGFGERFDLAKHPQGTEIKAITMHQMKILTPTTLTTEEGVTARTSDLMEGGTVREGFPYECYVLVDI